MSTELGDNYGDKYWCFSMNLRPNTENSFKLSDDFKYFLSFTI